MIFQIWIKSYPKNMSINFLPNMFTDFLGHVFRITFYPNLENQKIKNIFQKDDFSNSDKKLSEKHVSKFLPNMFSNFLLTCFSDNFLSKFGKSENKNVGRKEHFI